jgi:hypothetical protein
MHADDNDLERYLRGSGDNVDDLEAHIETCPSCRNRLACHAKFASSRAWLSPLRSIRGEKDQRREPRIATDQTGSMRILSPLTTNRENVRILDVSKSGMKVRVPSPVAMGAIVQVRVKNTHVLGEVRYCIEADEGFDIGLLIQDVQ